MSNIVYKNPNLVVFRKAVGTPSQADSSGGEDAMTLAARSLSELGESGELYLVHRLDRVVGGLMVFARNKKSAACLSEMVAGDGIGKEYFAVVEGRCESGSFTDYLIKDHVLKIAKISSPKKACAKLARLDFEALESVETPKGTRTLVRVRLHTGRFHQIRAQFSSRALPLVGDKKYGSKDTLSGTPALFSAHLSFALLGECIDVFSPPDISLYPWKLFSVENYK